MTADQWRALAAEYEAACGEPLPVAAPLDFGHIPLEEGDLIRYARAAIAAGRPIQWRAIYGPPVQDRPGDCVS